MVCQPTWKEMTLNKRFLIIILVLSFSCQSEAFAQKKRPLHLIQYDYFPYNFGFTLAVNQMLFSIKHQPYYSQQVFTGAKPLADVLPLPDSANLLVAESNPNWGFTIGIVSNLRLGNYMDLRFIPSLSFGERDLTYTVRTFNNGSIGEVEKRKPIQSTFVEFPLYIKYKSKRLNNVRSYIIAGPKYSIDLISDARRKEKTEGEVVKLYRNDIYLDLGIGFDFYNEYFKLGTEIRMSYGLRNLLKKDETIYTRGIDELRSKIFTLALTFE